MYLLFTLCAHLEKGLTLKNGYLNTEIPFWKDKTFNLIFVYSPIRYIKGERKLMEIEIGKIGLILK